MKTLLLKRDYQKAAKGLKGQFADPSHVRQTINETTKVIAPDGSTIAISICNAIPPALHKLAYYLWNTVHELPSNRAIATGSLSLHRFRNDGTLGNRRGVPRNVLKILAAQGVAHGSIGYLDATPDQPCHKTPLTRKHPELLHGNEHLVMLVDGLYNQFLPMPYAKQRAELENVPRWRLWHTVFSTIYLARNFRTAYHTDHGNLRGVMTALLVMGNFTGGELVLPRWRIAFALKPGDLLFFDPQQLHGNLPFEGKRLSAAFFCAGQIAKCGK